VPILRILQIILTLLLEIESPLVLFFHDYIKTLLITILSFNKVILQVNKFK